MVNTSFELELTVDGKKEVIEVMLQEVSPFVTTGVFSKALDVETNNYNMGKVADELIDVVVVSPKNLKERIGNADEPINAVAKIFLELQKFCQSPKRYGYVKAECKTKVKNMEHDNTKPNSSRRKKDE